MVERTHPNHRLCQGLGRPTPGMLQTSRARLPRAAWMMRIVPGRALRTGHLLVLTGERLLLEPAYPPRGRVHDANSGGMLRIDRERLLRTLTSHHFDPTRGRLDRFSHHPEGDSQQREGEMMRM